MNIPLTFLILYFIAKVKSQENAANSVAKSLVECYNNTENLDRERRPPSTINVLLDIIRKVEFGPSIQNDRELAIQLIHRFKQDGIVRFNIIGTSQYTIPYTPKGIQSDKHKIMLRKLIPGNAENFPNETLREIERCSLHFMLSDTIDLRKREGEEYVCNKLDRFQRRIRRDINEEIDLLQPFRSSTLKGNLQENTNPESINKETNTEFTQPGNSKKSVTITYSECPIEDGTVHTRWGTIQIGTVIAAIAAGIEPQKIHTEENYVVDNKFAVTLAGDLSEVSLHQGASGKQTLNVGAKGGWNETQTPRWYFVQKSSDLEMTDAEIRGDLDGLIIATKIKEWRSRTSSLKISQVLDMYYSPRGVFSKKYRACNRKELFTEFAPVEELTKQTVAFNFLLNGETKLFASILPEGIKAYGTSAVNSLINYIPTLQDLPCAAEDDTVERVGADMIIVLDTQWDFKFIERALGYLLDNMDINRFGGNFTIINAMSGETIVNSTNSLVDFYINYNRTIHLNNPSGIDASIAFNAVEGIIKRKMEEQKKTKKVDGLSSIILFVPYNLLRDNDKMGANIKKEYFRQYLPDLKLLVLGRNAKASYGDLVLDPNSDAFDLTDSSSSNSAISQSINALLSRIKQIPRRIINPNCGSNWTGDPSSNSFTQYVEPNGVNYYRLLPNYFFGEGEKTVKIQGYGYGNIIVCTSRQNSKPSQNASQDITCETISGTNSVSYKLNDYCKDYNEVTNCLPVYFSIQSVTADDKNTNLRCTERACRFPDNIKYTIHVDGLSCYSRSIAINGNIILSIIAIITIFYY